MNEGTIEKKRKKRLRGVYNIERAKLYRLGTIARILDGNTFINPLLRIRTRVPDASLRRKNHVMFVYHNEELSQLIMKNCVRSYSNIL